MKDARPYLLTKSTFLLGWYCPNYLWWKVHEPDAPELAIDLPTQDRFRQGREVGERAKDCYDGVEIRGSPRQPERKVEETVLAISGDAPAIFEAAFIEDNVFVAVDVLERLPSGGFRLVEVKSTNSVKDYHIPDVAIQAHVARKAGIDVRETALMHLNRDFRHPGPEDLLVTTDLTAEVEELLPSIPKMIKNHVKLLKGPEPDICVGTQCTKGWDCPFETRCWPQAPDHVKRLHRVGAKRALELMAQGIETFDDITEEIRLGAPAQRQLEAWRRNSLVVEPGLKEALDPFRGDVAFLDFETVSLAIPVWEGVAPWEHVPVQFSVHRLGRRGKPRHTQYLAEGAGDPRATLTEKLLSCTKGARSVAMYTPFELRCIRHLAEAVPDRAEELADLESRLVDLAPAVRDYVAHPDFGGSFSIKAVVPALVGDHSYESLEISDGLTASVQLAELLFRSDSWDRDRVKAKRASLLEYCEQDTWAMVELARRLEEIAATC